MDYYFKNDDPRKIIFAKYNQIFEMNVETEGIQTIHKFNPALKSQPIIFRSNVNQDIFVVSTRQDGIWVDVNQGKEVDLDEEFDINLINEVVLDEDEGYFYFLCNMRHERIGFYLIRF
jgi:hypothetical protein